MDDRRSQDSGRNADADNEEEDADNVDEELEVDDADREDKDKDEKELEGDEYEPEEDESELEEDENEPRNELEEFEDELEEDEDKLEEDEDELEDDEDEEETDEEGDEDEDTSTSWFYPDSDDSTSNHHGISLNHLNKQFDLLASASLVPMEQNQVELQEGLWGSMPEEILSNILVLLPVATQCRFRCVCSRWKLLLSAPSLAGRQVSEVESRRLCTVMTETESSESRFYSHAEDKWYRIPFRPKSYVDQGLDIVWRLHAADGGLLCYRNAHAIPHWLLVCNPITGAYQIVPYNFSLTSLTPHFLVHEESNSFTIVMMGHEEIKCFDSKTRLWNSCSKSGPGFRIEDNELVQKNILYSQFQQFDWSRGFGTKSEDHRAIEAALPCDARGNYHIICSKGHVMLVEFRPREDSIQIWKLVKEDTSALWLSRWEEVAVEVPVSMRPLVDHIQACWSHGNECICFATRWTHHWIKYTLATKTWRVMPCSGKTRPLVHKDRVHYGYYMWNHWEPCVDMHMDTVDPDFSEYRVDVAVAMYQWRRKKYATAGRQE